MLRVFEVFSGVGSQRMALRNIGLPHKVVSISEIDKFAIKSYEAIHGQTYNVGDISTVDTSRLPDFDLFTYSFPCQDISNAGLKQGFEKGSGTRSSLLWECERIIRDKRPKYLLLENVKALVNKKNKEHFDKWLKVLNDYGYTNYWQILNAKDYGIPQNRERVFVVSISGEHKLFMFPEKQELKLFLKNLLEDDVDDKYYLSQEQVEKLGKSNYQITRNKFLSIYEATKKGYVEAREGDSINISHLNSKTRRGRVGKQVANTLLTGIEQGVVLNDLCIRKLTPKECWRLMGFSDEDFAKASQVNSNSQLYKQAGNSIVVNVLEAIFKNLFFGQLEKQEKNINLRDKNSWLC